MPKAAKIKINQFYWFLECRESPEKGSKLRQKKSGKSCKNFRRTHGTVQSVRTRIRFMCINARYVLLNTDFCRLLYCFFFENYIHLQQGASFDFQTNHIEKVFYHTWLFILLPYLIVFQNVANNVGGHYTSPCSWVPISPDKWVPDLSTSKFGNLRIVPEIGKDFSYFISKWKTLGKTLRNNCNLYTLVGKILPLLLLVWLFPLSVIAPGWLAQISKIYGSWLADSKNFHKFLKLNKFRLCN